MGCDAHTDAPLRGAGIDPPSVVRSDGEHTWIDATADPATHHPTTLAPDPACPPEHEHDFYLWDLCGCERPTTAAATTATTTHNLRHRR